MRPHFFMGWWTRKSPRLAASVLFKGGLPPTQENAPDALEKAGAQAAPREGEGARWALDLRHREWGAATLVSLRDAPLPPPELLDVDSRLTPDEKALARAAGSALSLSMEPTGHVLRDRKHLLRLARAVMGPYGLLAADHVAQTFWSREAIDEELAHDGDMDIQGLFTLHAVTEEGGRVVWLHTHGLRELGLADFDIVDPAPELTGPAFDLVRATAFAIAEGKAWADGGAFHLASPGGDVRLVSAAKAKTKPGRELARWAEGADEEHTRGHAVVCEPAGTLASLFGGRAKPSRFLSGPMPEELLIHFSTEASDLMAERAKSTYGVFRALLEEFAFLPLPGLVKLGYVVDGGGPADREHLWFEVETCLEGAVEAKLVNEPFRIARMRAGQTGRHDVALLSDWTILTPAGPISPRTMSAARVLRAKKDELREAMRRQR